MHMSYLYVHVFVCIYIFYINFTMPILIHYFAAISTILYGYINMKFMYICLYVYLFSLLDCAYDTYFCCGHRFQYLIKNYA